MNKTNKRFVRRGIITGAVALMTVSVMNLDQYGAPEDSALRTNSVFDEILYTFEAAPPAPTPAPQPANPEPAPYTIAPAKPYTVAPAAPRNTGLLRPAPDAPEEINEPDIDLPYVGNLDQDDNSDNDEAQEQSRRLVESIRTWTAAPATPTEGAAQGAAQYRNRPTKNDVIVEDIERPVVDADLDGLIDALDPFPFIPDSDGDGIPDGLELRAGNDPVRVDTIIDTDENGIPDKVDETYKKQYNLSVARGQGSRDTDSDGMSDKMEMFFNTNPLKEDSDNDTATDTEEIFNYKTDPNEADDPEVFTKILVISNLQYGAIIAGDTLIVGGAPFDTVIECFASNIDENEAVEFVDLGKTESTDNGKFILWIPDAKLKEGEEYKIDCNGKAREDLDLLQKLMNAIVFAQDSEDTYSSQSVLVRVSRAPEVAKPKVTKLAEHDIPEGASLSDLRLTIKDNQPYIEGTSELDTRVTVNWASALFTSALIADSEGGFFSVPAPQPLDYGDHRVFVLASRTEAAAKSETVMIPFEVTVDPEADRVPVSGVDQEARPAAGNGKRNYLMIGLIAGAGLFVIGGVVFGLRKRRAL